jgi:hypothetical protein
MATMELKAANSETGEENPKINKEEGKTPQLQPIQAPKINQLPGHNAEITATEATLREEEGISPAQKGQPAKMS